jgi:hypothetical protein
MAIWVFQVGPGWLHIIDYTEGSNEGFDYYCDWLSERGYVPDRGEGAMGMDFVPHDAKQRSPTANGTKTRIQELFALKRNPVLVPDHKVADRINATRRLINSPNTYFDAERCSIGLEMLRSYRQEWDIKNRVFRKAPKHDFASHGSDAFGHLAVAVEYPAAKPEDEKFTKVEAKLPTINDLLRNTPSENRTWL